MTSKTLFLCDKKSSLNRQASIDKEFLEELPQSLAVYKTIVLSETHAHLSKDILNKAQELRWHEIPAVVCLGSVNKVWYDCAQQVAQIKIAKKELAIQKLRAIFLESTQSEDL